MVTSGDDATLDGGLKLHAEIHSKSFSERLHLSIKRKISIKDVVVLITGRLIKLMANITKLLSYGFHLVQPKKCFTLPERAAPWWKRRQSYGAIPRIIWYTNFINRVNLPVYLNYLCNRLMSSSFEYRFMITEARGDFIQANYQEDVYRNYFRLQIGAAQADVWRVLMLLKDSGVYLDIVVYLHWPLAGILKREKDELLVVTRRAS